ncbi:hypothetical protein D3C72_2355660 [compost metagenome]
MVMHLQRLASDPGLREQLGINARHRAEALFGEEQAMDRYIALYEQLTSGARAYK